MAWECSLGIIFKEDLKLQSLSGPGTHYLIEIMTASWIKKKSKNEVTT